MTDNIKELVERLQHATFNVVLAKHKVLLVEAVSALRKLTEENERMRAAIADRKRAALEAVAGRLRAQGMAEVIKAATPGPGGASFVSKEVRDAIDRAGRIAGMREAAACQPSTAEDPNESAYQRGRFDGIIEFGTAIHTKAAELEQGK